MLLIFHCTFSVTGDMLTASNKCHYLTSSLQWSDALLMSSPRAWAASSLAGTDNNNQMILLGGVDRDNDTLDTIEVIDIEEGVAIKISLALPTPLAGHCAVQLNSSHTFIAGGAVTGMAGLGEQPTLSNTAWILSDAGWASAGQLRDQRSLHSCSSVFSHTGDHEVLVAGGIGLTTLGTRQVLDSVEIYNVATGRWRTAASLPQPVFGASFIRLAGQPVLIGGHDQEDGQLVQSSSSHTYEQEWRSSTIKLNTPRGLAVVLAAPSFC